ncbi:MAG: hypothetical protein MUC63_01445 [Planctomycetes bacterium]|jgi:hypothetical protein|nr:hypothetical protein [Planctomycetota bacterium]
MADDTCIRCRRGRYRPIDRETDVRDREFVLFECESCKSLVIRRREGAPPGRAKADAAPACL